MPLLEFDKVSKLYDVRRHSHGIPVETDGEEKSDQLDAVDQGIQALNEVSFSISPGETVGVIGESGAGKTTLASIATGQIKPTSGRILVEEEELSGANRTCRRNARIIQLVWQDTMGSVDPRMKVRSIIEEPLRVHNLSPGDGTHGGASSLLQEVGLTENLAERYPQELSGGELQRVVIARALALSPRLLICDEPVSSLDVQAKLQVADLLTRLQAERNLALMVIAHDLYLVRRITRELLVMNRGAIVERGPTEMLIKRPSHPYTKMLIGFDTT